MEQSPTGSSTDASGPRYPMTLAEKRLSRTLLDQNLITEAQVLQALDFAIKNQVTFQGALLRLKLVTPDVVAKVAATRTTGLVPALDPSAITGGTLAGAMPGGPPRKRLGTFLLEAGAITQEQLDQALKYAKDKNVMIGSAIVSLNLISEDKLSEFLVQHQKDTKHQSRTRRLKLGEILVERGLLTAEKLEQALIHAKSNKVRLGEALQELNLVKEIEIAQCLSQQLGLPLVNLSKNPPDPQLLLKIPRKLCEKHAAMPFRLEGKVLTAAMVDPLNIIALDDFQNHTGWTVLPVIVTRSDFGRAVAAYYGMDDGSDGIEIVMDPTADPAAAMMDEAPLVALVNRIIGIAVQKAASDVHIDPMEHETVIRYRVDGVLRDVGLKCPKEVEKPIVSRIKVMSALDIAETRMPQDGKFRQKIEGRTIDFRVSTVPTVWGEKVVIRLLDQSKARSTVDGLGMEPYSEQIFRDAIRAPNGITLVTGPTGSGKSTTLYAAMLEVNDPTVNVHTAEDPVEFTLPGISQVAVKASVGLTFASALKAFLRQDPDVIVIGEIRDSETASIALKAAMTGHLVLSTLHTNDAISTIDRLLTMGMDRFILASALRAIVAQRLVRRLCTECRRAEILSEEMRTKFQVEEAHLKHSDMMDTPIGDLTIYQPVGCDHCNDGYRGRTGVYEVLGCSTELKELIVEGGSNFELFEKARQLGMITLRDSAIIRVLKGLSSFAEVERITVTPPANVRREAYKIEPEEEKLAASSGGGALDARALSALESIATRLEKLSQGAAPATLAAAARPGSVEVGTGLARMSGFLATSARAMARNPNAATDGMKLATWQMKKLEMLSSPAAPQLQSVDVAHLLSTQIVPDLEKIAQNASLGLAQHVKFQELRVNQSYDPETPCAQSDPELLTVVIEELLENACASLVNGGTLRIFTKPVMLNEALHTEITVVDNGAGVQADDVLNRPPFQSTRARGLGAGLAVVRKLLESLGGTFELISKPGKGCAARVRLPAIGL